MARIGFMQGRLSPKPADRIQAFPKDSWREEFPRAKEIGFDCLELIHDTLHWESNPLKTDSGRRELVALSHQTGVALQSICADTFMVKPLVDHLELALETIGISREIGCGLVEFPFVDSSSMRRQKDPAKTVEVLCKVAEEAAKQKIGIAIETDLPPIEFRDLLNQLPANVGANLDLGNSAALGYDAISECRAFGNRIVNVHIKDRMLGGTTVPLLTGNTDFERAFRGLRECKYSRDYILQTCPDPDFLGIAAKYRKMVKDWITKV